MSKWMLKRTSANVQLMAETLNISEELAVILANRNIRTKLAALKFLNPELKYQYDPLLMSGMEEAVKLISEAAIGGEKIVVYGDYDVDGVTSSVILYKTLKSFGADVTYYIPHREKEGYGLNMSAVKTLSDSNVGLIFTCDNGIASFNEIKYAHELGVKVVVLDHHEPFEGRLPEADALIDPKRDDCKYPFKFLCAGGLAYKFSRAFFEYNKTDYKLHDEFLILASIATFCDIVEIIDENRIIAKNGLRILNEGRNTNLGLKALLRRKNLINKELTEFDIGFIIGPCINASGRLEVAELAVKLFLTDDYDEAETLASRLSELNDERKAMTAAAVAKVTSGLTEITPVIVIYDTEIHESVAGIVAGRIKEYVHRPVIVLTKGETLVKGSARSIEGYNVFEELSKCADLFERFGGHAMAAGLSLKEDNVPELKKRLNANCTLSDDDFQEIVYIDKELDIKNVNFKLANELLTLKPFGRENKEPCFTANDVDVMQIDFLGENKKTLRFIFGGNIKGVCFNKYDELSKALKERYSQEICDEILKTGKNLFLKFDIIYSVDINEYNGNKSVQIKVKDFKLK